MYCETVAHVLPRLHGEPDRLALVHNLGGQPHRGLSRAEMKQIRDPEKTSRALNLINVCVFLDAPDCVFS